MTRPRTTETATPSPRLDARIRQYWSHRAAGFGQVRQQELHSDKAERWWAEIAPYLPAPDDKKPLRVLDVGSGAGFLAILLARHGCEATGLDSCLPMLDEARAEAEEMVSETEIMQKAREEARATVNQALAEASDKRLAAAGYADGLLDELDKLLTDMGNHVRSKRSELAE